MNIGSVEASFKIAGLEKSLKDLGTLHNRLNEVGEGLGNTFSENLKLIEGFKQLSKAATSVLKNQTELKTANDAVVASGKRIVAQLEQEKIQLNSLIKKEQELLVIKQRVASFNSAPSNFRQFSQQGTVLGGQSSAYRTDLSNPIKNSWAGFVSPVNAASASIAKFTNEIKKATQASHQFLLPSKQIQDTLQGWWQHFGRIGLGFGAIYGALRAVTQAARYAFNIFAGGVKVMDDIRSSGAMVAGMLAMVTKNGKTFADNYTQYFANFTKVIGRVTTLLPQYGLTMEQFIAGTRELAQFGVVVDNDNLRESIISMKLIQEIASNTKQDTRQIRQELQAFFSGQARMSDQFARTVNNSMPELSKAIEKIRNEGGTTQEMWAKLSSEMFKMEPSIKAANMNLGVQHEVLKANLSVISATALEATGLYDIWLNGLSAFNDSLFDAKGGLTEFGEKVYKVFFKGWEWAKEWGQMLLGVGQVIYGGLIMPFLTLFRLLADIKNIIIDMGKNALPTLAKGLMQILTKDYFGALKTLGGLEQAKEAGLDVIQGFVDQGQMILKGLENFVVGDGLVFTDNYIPPSKALADKMQKAVTGLSAPGGVDDKAGKASKEAGHKAGLEFADAWTLSIYERVQEYFSSDELEKFELDIFSGMGLDFPKDGMGPPAQVKLYQSSQINFWNTVISAQEEYTQGIEKRINREELVAKIQAKASLGTYFGSSIKTAAEEREAIDLIVAEQKRLSTNWDFEMNKMKLSFDSFGSYLGNSFSGLFSSVFNHEITSFAQFFQGALKSIQQSFSDMLADMVSEYFTAMMKLKFAKNAVGIMDGLSGTFFGTPQTSTGYQPTNSDFSLSGSGPFPVGSNLSLMDNNLFTGGMINEPVWGVGASGATYSFAEKGPERVLSNAESKGYGKASAPSTTINFINESGTPLTATQGTPQFDGEKYVTSIIVKQMSSNPSFRSSMRG